MGAFFFSTVVTVVELTVTQVEITCIYIHPVCLMLYLICEGSEPVSFFYRFFFGGGGGGWGCFELFAWASTFFFSRNRVLIPLCCLLFRYIYFFRFMIIHVLVSVCPSALSACGSVFVRYGDQKVAEGVDGAELLTLHEKGLMPLEGEENKSGEDSDGMQDDAEEDDDGDEIPNLVALPATSKASAAAGGEAEDDGGDEDMLLFEGGSSKKRVREDGDEDEDDDDGDEDDNEEQGEEEEEQEEEGEGGEVVSRSSKRARREAADGGAMEMQDAEEEEEEEEDDGDSGEVSADKGGRRSKKPGVKFSSEVKKVDGPGPSGALDGAGPSNLGKVTR